MGGEKLLSSSFVSTQLGSPPHGRGKGGNLPGRVRSNGITPAWAGKSVPDGIILQLSGDHPRMGGEKRYFHLYHSCR